jgi:hypothetical protein
MNSLHLVCGVVFLDLHGFVDFSVPCRLGSGLKQGVAPLNPDFDHFRLRVVQGIRLLLQFCEPLARILLVEFVPLSKFPAFLDELHLNQRAVHRHEILDFLKCLVHRRRHVQFGNKRFIEFIINLDLAYSS